ncbi:MAG: YcjF family protein [Desulfobacterales bacterium]|nr:YcjF family protein [Desulfobacterales bacterium]
MTKTVSKEELESIVNKHTLASTGLGLIPLPLADLAGLMTIQLNMVRKLAELYDVPFIKEAVKKLLSTLLGAFLLGNSLPFLASAVKIIPGLGQAIGAVAMPLACGASTYAAGKVFILHFASGGNLLTFDPARVKAYYKEMFEEGKTVVAEMKYKEKIKRGKS